METNGFYYDPNFPIEDDVYLSSNGTPDFKYRKMTQNRVAKRGENKGKVKIEVEVEQYIYTGTGTNDRTRFYINTNIWVDPRNWSNKSQKLSNKEEDAEYKNNVINNTYAAVVGIISSKGQQELNQPYIEAVNFSKLREIFPSRKEQRKSFFDLMVNYKTIRASDGETSKNTVKRINTVANTIKKYDAQSKKTFIEDINFMWSDNFNAWLVGTKKFAPSTISRTYEIICGCMAYYWKRRDELNLQIQDKFKDADFKKGKKEGNAPHALLASQREILFNHTCEKPYMEKARKMMCIQTYSACRYSDIKKFMPEHFKKKGFLKFRPQKTSRYSIDVDQPLHPNLKQLFEEVNYNTSIAYSTSNQKYDDYILDVLRELIVKYPDAGFTDDYSSHNMRDSAISIWVKSGVNFKSILRWAGLRKYETLDHYIDIDDSFEQQEMTKTIVTPEIGK